MMRFFFYMLALGLFAGTLTGQEDSSAWVRKGQEAMNAGKSADAEIAFHKAVDLDPQNAAAHVLLANATLRQVDAKQPVTTAANMARVEKARAELEEALKIEPDRRDAAFLLATVVEQIALQTTEPEQRAARFAEALRVCRRLVAADPTNKALHLVLARVASAQFSPVLAQARVQAGMKAGDTAQLRDAALRQDLADKYAAVIEEGIANARRALEIDPSYAPAMLQLAALMREHAAIRDRISDHDSDLKDAAQWQQKGLSQHSASISSTALSPQTMGDPLPNLSGEGEASSRLGGSPESGVPQDNKAYRIGGSVSAPTVVSNPPPAYSEEARKSKLQGTVVLFIVVDENGKPQAIKVIRHLGLGLDEKAIEAVQKWRFKPGMKDGVPVAVQATVEVNFRLLDFPWPGGAPKGWTIANERFGQGGPTPMLVSAPSNLMPRPEHSASFEVNFNITPAGFLEDVVVAGPQSPEAAAIAAQMRQWAFTPTSRDNAQTVIRARFTLSYAATPEPKN